MINRFFPEMNPEYRRGELLVFVKVVPGKPNEYFLAYGSTAPNTFRTELPPGKRVINGRIEDAPIPAVEPERCLLSGYIPELSSPPRRR